MVRVDMQNGINPPFPGIDSFGSIMVFRSMGISASREGIGGGMFAKEGGVDFLNYVPYRYVIVIVLRGRGTFIDDHGRQYPLEAGSFFQRLPGIPHSDFIEHGSNWFEVYLETGPLFYQALRAMRIIRAEHPVQKFDPAQDLMLRVWRLVNDLQTASEKQLAELSVDFLDILKSCFHNSGAALPKEENEDVIEQACNVLGTSFTEPVDMHDFCSRRGWGYEHFRKVFKARLGISPWQYRIRRKLDVASALLLDKQRSIVEIAEDLGYSSAYEFSAQFKRYLGVSPRFYRDGRK